MDIILNRNITQFHPRYMRAHHLWRTAQYRKGAFEGDAPFMDRRKSHARVLAHSLGDPIRFRFHRTDIVTLYPDGSWQVFLDGYESRPTTRYALWRVSEIIGLPQPHIISTERKFGVSHRTLLGVPIWSREPIHYAADGTRLTLPDPWKAKRVNRAEVAEWRSRIKASGYMDTLPMLHMGCVDYSGPSRLHRWYNPRDALDIMSDPTRVEEWVPVTHWLYDQVSSTELWAVKRYISTTITQCSSYIATVEV